MPGRLRSPHISRRGEEGEIAKKKTIADEIAAAEQSTVINIVGDLKLHSMKGNRIAFQTEGAGEIIDYRMFVLDRSILPPDYDHEAQEIAGSINIILEIKKKGGDEVGKEASADQETAG